MFFTYITVLAVIEAALDNMPLMHHQLSLSYLTLCKILLLKYLLEMRIYCTSELALLNSYLDIQIYSISLFILC